CHRVTEPTCAWGEERRYQRSQGTRFEYFGGRRGSAIVGIHERCGARDRDRCVVAQGRRLPPHAMIVCGTDETGARTQMYSKSSTIMRLFRQGFTRATVEDAACPRDGLKHRTRSGVLSLK
ncbi:hypothetical protein RSAG8_00352, partial [Rhizoctonia solani AG-8 WAC10335]